MPTLQDTIDVAKYWTSINRDYNLLYIAIAKEFIVCASTGAHLFHIHSVVKQGTQIVAGGYQQVHSPEQHCSKCGMMIPKEVLAVSRLLGLEI